ncbi:MSCRAMM family protein [Kutzneria sp. CA-103260]|uniref:MSCRAMM family protein n=1 Tax=Kutzneria sp. CA-103260 TaxID=2802641 RepID=UPI001BEDDEF1|nr:SpaA isopeptide-forming pilin-related protein [Kutzneria sp. CA-103260]QUQ69182.1 Prealbumin-like fold domain protein [Kutzneria sp. CA-103260]
MGLSKLVAGVTGITMLVAGLGVLAAPTASAAVQTGSGLNVPKQPYKGSPANDPNDWLGQYIVGGKAAYCVRFALAAPDSGAKYDPDGDLTDKWGGAIDPTKLAEVSYILLRYGDTTGLAKDVGDAQAAAVAHILHSITSGGRPANPNDGPNEVAYDTALHLKELPQAAQDDVAKIQTDAAANYGPWKATVTPPTAAQVIGTADKWTINVVRDGGDGAAIKGVPVKLTVTDGKVDSDTVTTPADGSPLVVNVTPTGPNPTVKIDLDAPLAKPTVQKPENQPANFQWTVFTGGQGAITSTGKTTATTAPGSVKVTKVDSKTGAGIANVQLRVTAADKTAAAVKQDGSPLNGTDGKPLVVTTGADGTATVDGLKTPQDICIIEVAAPAGYDQNFDASSPPNACGSIQAGQTLALKVANTPNTPTVPVKIPAGGSPMVADAATVTTLDPAALAAVGGLAVIGLGGVGLLLRRRRHASRG